jgi:hypothetical protein
MRFRLHCKAYREEAEVEINVGKGADCGSDRSSREDEGNVQFLQSRVHEKGEEEDATKTKAFGHEREVATIEEH